MKEKKLTQDILEETMEENWMRFVGDGLEILKKTKRKIRETKEGPKDKGTRRKTLFDHKAPQDLLLDNQTRKKQKKNENFSFSS